MELVTEIDTNPKSDTLYVKLTREELNVLAAGIWMLREEGAGYERFFPGGSAELDAERFYDTCDQLHSDLSALDIDMG